MYGILNFEKSSATVTALRDVQDDGWCGRGSACEGCRISRVRCTGKLNATHCDRCKRLGKACRYINNNPLSRHNQHHKRRHYDLIHAPGDDEGLAAGTGSGRGVAATRARGSVTTSGCAKKHKRPSSAPGPDSDPGRGPDSDPGLGPNSPPPLLVGTDAAPPISLADDDAWWQGLDLGPMASSAETLWSSSLALLDTSGDHYIMSAGIDLPEPSPRSDEADQPPAPRLRAATISTTSSSLQQSLPATTNCSCLQVLTSSLTKLRNWQRDTNLEALGQAQGGHTPMQSLNREIGSFLVLFEESMVQLRVVEDCPFACVLSPELAILLLLVVEQLARLLVGSDSIGRCSGSPLDPAPPRRLQMTESTKTSEDSLSDSQVRCFGSIGTFHLRDPTDQCMVVKILLEIRTHMLHGFITRLGSQMIKCGLGAIEFDLRRVQEELGKAYPFDNESLYTTVDKPAWK